MLLEHLAILDAAARRRPHEKVSAETRDGLLLLANELGVVLIDDEGRLTEVARELAPAAVNALRAATDFLLLADHLAAYPPGGRIARPHAREERTLQVVHREEHGDAVTMRCDACGAGAPFDDTLPYVNQTASFATGHGCLEVDPDR